ncbi:MAG TPA: adenylate/guanylate cyclase domain-containing protein [Actinomycetota bacterium]|nr:adenylate/guanylate cyclase domain-containing protein [Actinomycetota bacterium]
MFERRIATVLMLDVVGSTHVAAELGDARYRELSSRFGRVVRTALKRFGGREEDNAGDGFFVTFDQPDRAIRCAAVIADEIRGLGIEVRCGVHTGQVESGSVKAQGIAVVIGARVMSLAGPGEILVTSTTKELVTGSDFAFEALSAHELKGVPGTWQVFAVIAVDGSKRAGPLPAADAAERRASLEPAIGSRSRPTAWWMVAAVALLVIAVVAVVSVDGEPPSVPPRAGAAPSPESFVQVDPVTGEILVEIEAPVSQRGLPGMQRGTPDHPMVVGLGGVWSLRSYRWLYFVDPSTGSIRRVITLETPGSFSVNVAAGLDEAWVVYDQGLLEVDPATQEQRVVLDLPSEDTPASSDAVIGAGYLWIVTTQGRLYRYDPNADRAREIRVGGSPDAIGFGHGSVWIGDAFAGTVERIDAASMKRRAVIDIQQGVDNIVVGEDVWVLSRTLHALTRIDPTTNRAGPSVPIGDAPTGLAAGDGAIWIGDEDGMIRRIDEATRQVTEIPFGAEIRALAYDDETDTLWIDVAGPE